MKNRTFIESIVCAFKGMIYTVRTEKNYKYYAVISLFFLVINIVLKIDFYGHIFYMITAIGVLAADCINTAIEHVCNKITTSVDTEIKIIKDIGAGNVLFWGIAFFIVEFIFIGKVLI